MVKVLGNLKIMAVEKHQRRGSNGKRNMDGGGWRMKRIGNDDFGKFSLFSKYTNDDVAPLRAVNHTF